MKIIDAIAYGGLGGVAGTAAMTVVMVVARGARVVETHELPPEQVMAGMLNRAQLPRDDLAQDILSMAAHLAFGSGAGTVFGLLSLNLRPPLRPSLQGMLFGAGIWTTSYAGWLPALRILPLPWHDRPAQQVMLILEHLVYGTVLGATTHRLQRRR